MLLADKHDLQQQLKLSLLHIEEKELHFYTQNCYTVGTQASCGRPSPKRCAQMHSRESRPVQVARRFSCAAIFTWICVPTGGTALGFRVHCHRRGPRHGRCERVRYRHMGRHDNVRQPHETTCLLCCACLATSTTLDAHVWFVAFRKDDSRLLASRLPSCKSATVSLRHTDILLQVCNAL